MEPFVNSKILIADDDNDHLILFRRVIQQRFPEVEVAVVKDGQSLLHYIHLHPVDLLFLDLDLPDRTGFDCLQAIRKDPAVVDLPVVVYSGSAHLSDIQRSFLLHADFYLVKPFQLDHLVKALDTILAFNWREQSPVRHHYFMNNRFVPFNFPD